MKRQYRFLMNNCFVNILGICYISKKSDNLQKLSDTINEKGTSKIQISINETSKKYLFELKNRRKFNYETLKILNKEHYITKISV